MWGDFPGIHEWWQLLSSSKCLKRTGSNWWERSSLDVEGFSFPSFIWILSVWPFSSCLTTKWVWFMGLYALTQTQIHALHQLTSINFPGLEVNLAHSTIKWKQYSSLWGCHKLIIVFTLSLRVAQHWILCLRMSVNYSPTCTLTGPAF